MHQYKVGTLYNPRRRSWPGGSQYQFRLDQHELLLFFNRPTPREIEDVKRGAAEFAFLTSEDVLVFLFRFGREILWSDAPYSIHMVPAEQRTVPEPSGAVEPHALLSVILVDASSGIIHALRAVSFSPAFTAALHLAIREQAARPWSGQAAYDRQLTELYTRYPTSEALLPLATARTAVGPDTAL